MLILCIDKPSYLARTAFFTSTKICCIGLKTRYAVHSESTVELVMRRPEAKFVSPVSASVATQLGHAVRLARLGRNLTQGDFAQRARISLATLQRIERGDPAVSFTSWLSAMEAGALLPILKAAADPSADARGNAQRQLEQRRRASKVGSKASPADAYAF